VDQGDLEKRIGEWDRELADQAAEVMRAFGPDGPKAPTLGLLSPDATGGLHEAQLFSWCVRNPALPPVVNVAEVVQVLERAGLVCEMGTDRRGTRRWGATQLGLATLAGGKDVVRQRIMDRTGVASGMGGSTVTPPRRSIAQRLQELETLRATGVISEAEYAAKREQIINEI
jgi:hypothetical protein